jgi:starch phosphorylase
MHMTLESGKIEQMNNYVVKIAYFSMEVGLEQEVPTYSGGLGILAGDTLKSCADLHLPVVGMTLLQEKGYFIQRLDENGNQSEEPVKWDPSTCMELLPYMVKVTICGRVVAVQAWRYMIRGVSDARVPVYFLDTNIEDNHPQDREITSYLYGGDEEYRFKQEVVLGIGGVRILRAMGYNRLTTFHMNEGHASLLTLELLRENEKDPESVWFEQARWDPETVKDLCVFTTHTPVPAGHDRFQNDLVKRILGEKKENPKGGEDPYLINKIPYEIVDNLSGKGVLNMTLLALNLSRYANGVAKKHGQVSKEMFPEYEIDSITNGVHVRTWMAREFRALMDEHVPGWQGDSFLLRQAVGIPPEKIWAAHQACKERLFAYVAEKRGVVLDPEVLTIGFARRAAAYKRGDLLFRDIDRLRDITRKAGKFQLIFAGKAHPKDEPGKDLIRRIFQRSRELADTIPIVYLENYDFALGKLMTAGVDVWLNNPKRPQEASGTSGMKATLNGVINFSVLDGWWLEGHREGITGWSIGPRPSRAAADRDTDASDVRDLYEKLEKIILPMYYEKREEWLGMMLNGISLNGSFFNTNRMMLQYVSSAYLRRLD